MLQFGLIPTSEFLYVVTNHATVAIFVAQCNVSVEYFVVSQ